MRALVDRHQADLFYAMQVLLEDRLGIEVWTTIGDGWFDAGYWQFGHQHFGRALANQFLGIDARYTPTGEGTYVTFDPAHPERAIRCVTLDGFRARDWSHVVATVEDNQAGFARLAGEVGAKYVLQVGNTRQTVDWGLDPLALVSSEVAIAGRGVRIHQPMDAAFRYREPGVAGPRIASFVNLFPRLVDWPLWEALRDRLPDGWTNGIYGIDGPDGNLHPVSAIANEMARSAFGLQLKPTGDGFGHVIHNWAAVGRPIVWVADYYRDKLAAPLFVEGVNAWDIGRHTEAELVALMRRLRDDDEFWLNAATASRDRFDSLVSFDAEAQAIAGMLGL